MSEGDDSTIARLKNDLSLFKSTLIAFLAVATTSTIFFHFVEQWRWLDSLYFTIVTMSTVGYGNIVPVTDLGKVGNVLLIILGIGIFTVFAMQLVKRHGLRRLEKEEAKRKK